MSTPTGPDLGAAVQRVGDALLVLGQSRPELAFKLANLTTSVITEAGRTARFANAVETALASSPTTPSATPRRTGRRAAGAIDPFAVYGHEGEAGLRDQLSALDLEQLRDIVAQHGMDHDRLAMKWKDPARVIDRIVEKVTTRSAKGSAFRDA